jgi:ABC-2 type transport system ATP-binding protein
VSFTASDAASLAGIPGAHDVRLQDGRARLAIDSDAVATALPALGALGVQGLRIEPASLEELFLRHYGDDPVDAAPVAGARS